MSKDGRKEARKEGRREGREGRREGGREEQYSKHHVVTMFVVGEGCAERLGAAPLQHPGFAKQSMLKISRTGAVPPPTTTHLLLD